jgi:hypothetical protein
MAVALPTVTLPWLMPPEMPCVDGIHLPFPVLALDHLQALTQTKTYRDLALTMSIMAFTMRIRVRSLARWSLGLKDIKAHTNRFLGTEILGTV